MSYKIADIRMIRKDDHKRFEGYAFIDNNIELRKVGDENDDSNSSSSSSSYNNKKYKKMCSS
jgi:hypothetical protein